MPEWTRDMVEERITEAAAVLRRLPPVRVAGYFGTWPEIQRTAKELAEAAPDEDAAAAAEHRCDLPHGGGDHLEPFPRARRCPPDVGARRGRAVEGALLSVRDQPADGHRRWEYALSVIVWRLNGRQVHHRRGRRFVIARAH